MEAGITEIRKRTVADILARQDDHFRWGYDGQAARQRPELAYYLPGYQATLWTLLLLAEIKAPVDDRRINRSLDIVQDHFYDRTNGIFSLGKSHFPIPCLNGNMLFLNFYFQKPSTARIEGIVDFFDTYQRFDDGGFKTPKVFPYFSNTACYGKHTCYWGVVKLLKGLSFIPASHRTGNARRLMGNCIDFILSHEVCFRSHDKSEFLRPGIGTLTFPNLWKGDYLEVLWLLSRERVSHQKITRAVDLLRSKMKSDGSWDLERPAQKLIIPMGKKGCAGAFITERALEVLDFYGH